MFAAFAMFAGLAYWYYKDTQKALQTYAQNQATLESSLSMQKQATESLRSNIKIMTETITKLNDDFADSRKNVAELQNIFTKDKDGKKRDFGELTIAEPEVIQKEIIENHDGRTAVAHAHEVAKLAEGWAFDMANGNQFEKI